MKGCASCYAELSGEEIAEKGLREAGFRPLDTYRGMKQSRHCECLLCGRQQFVSQSEISKRKD